MNINNITLRQLRAFMAGATSASFSEAAERIHITQPGYSLLIRQLEEELGLKLFDRTTRSRTLTGAGQEFYQRVSRILGDLDEVIGEVNDMKDPRRGKVTIAVLPSVASGVIPSVFRSLSRLYPGIAVTIYERLATPLIDCVNSGEADFGFGINIADMRELQFEPLMADTLVGIFNEEDALAEQAQIEWKDLAGRPYICFANSSSLNHYVEAATSSIGVVLQIAAEVAYMTTAISLVRGGSGFTLLPEMALSSLNLAGLAVRNVSNPIIRRDLGIIIPEKRSISSSAQAAIESFRQICREMS